MNVKVQQKMCTGEGYERITLLLRFVILERSEGPMELAGSKAQQTGPTI